MSNFFGGDGPDTLIGTAGADLILVGRGNDLANGLDGNDEMDTRDTSMADGDADGDDTLNGGAGNDSLYGGTGRDVLSGGDGDDSLTGFSGNTVMNGDEGNDFLNSFGTTGSDTLDGGAGNDTLFGGSDADVLLGGLGNDSMSSATTAGADSMSGGEGSDTIIGGLGNDTIEGDGGNDSLYGWEGNDRLFGGDGDDLLSDLDGGANGNDLLDGGAGNDTISGGAGFDTLLGGAGNDMLSSIGSADSDTLNGGAGRDTLHGSSGADTLIIGADGYDEAYGGAGNDVYQINGKDFYIHDTGGIDTAVVSASFVKLPNFIESVSYVGGAQALPYWIDALLPDDANGRHYAELLGPTKTFYFGFATAFPSYNTTAADGDGFLAFNDVQKAFTRQAFTYVSTVTGLSFVETLDLAVPNVISFANNTATGNLSGYAYFPGSGSRGSDVFIDKVTTGNLSPADAQFSALVLIHELGHALGLKHPFGGTEGTEGPFLSAAENNTTATVMSYDSTSAQYHLAYSPFDLAALQYMYGPSTTARAGDDTYLLDASGANFLWDGAGMDDIDASAMVQSIVLYLEPGYWGHVGTKASTISAAGQITVNFGTVIEGATGGSAADAITGNSVANTLRGGAGNDTLTGAAGNDTLVGGAGDDRFEYRVDLGEGIDTITDFATGDTIRVDALLSTAAVTSGNGSTLNGKGIQAVTVAGTTTLSIDTDNVAGADLQLHLTGAFDAMNFTVTSQGDGSTLIGYTVRQQAPTGAVTFSGTLTQNQTLTAANTLADPNGMGTVSYQWLADGQAISGATNTTLELAQTQVGKVIAVRASYTDGLGKAESVTSAVTTQKVANVNDAVSGSVTVSGSYVQDQVLTATNSLADIDGLGTVGYQWLANGNAIAGATGSTLVLAQAQVGKTVTVRASYVDDFGASESVTSSAFAAGPTPTPLPQVQNLNDAPVGSVVIGGNAYVGRQLTASNTLADIDGLGAVVYQWKADGAAIADATTAAYTVTAAELGKTITLTASYTDDFGASESVTSTATAAVIEPPPGVQVQGMAYHWKGHALLSGVTVSGTAGSALPDQATIADGLFRFDTVPLGVATFGATRGTADSGSAITSADALAALRIAVGISPNTDPDGTGPLAALKVSPFQMIAADVNGDGKVSSVDALGILRMAVKTATAPVQKWEFVSERLDLWNESIGVSALTNLSAGWSNGSVDLQANLTHNFVGVLRGDVNGSWTPPSGSTSTDLDVTQPTYFTTLGTQLGVPTDVWGL